MSGYISQMVQNMDPITGALIGIRIGPMLSIGAISSDLK